MQPGEVLARGHGSHWCKVPPFSLKKYFDPTLPTATIQPTTISKVNTTLQFLLIAVSLSAPLAGLQNHPSLHYLWAATGATTFLSAVSYAFMKVTTFFIASGHTCVFPP